MWRRLHSVPRRRGDASRDISLHLEHVNELHELSISISFDAESTCELMDIENSTFVPG